MQTMTETAKKKKMMTETVFLSLCRALRAEIHFAL